ncbi:MAG: hypothetical protein K8S15_09860, partial [Candidatus Aegiribacteria sp.]|nr:hypothetical protein [Candidatus Aegiribacteria sp.]
MTVPNTYCEVILSFLILAAPTIVNANNPTPIPWPVGSSENQMDSTKTLMNSYGDPQNDWSLGMFHAGVDFDSHTESPPCYDVRCVIDDAVISHWYGTPFQPDTLPWQWVVVTTEGTDSLNHEEFGWSYGHLSDPRVPPHYWNLWDPISKGDLITTMNPYVQTIHTHFKWTTWDHDNTCYVNPLDYLTPSPIQGSGFTWTFNPKGYTPSFEYFFLADTLTCLWPIDPDDVPGIMLDENDLSDNVDVFFGFGLQGEGQSTTPACGRNDLAPERIKWDMIRETTSEDDTLETNFVVNFDCLLSSQGQNEKVWQLYFRHDLDDMCSYIPDSLSHEGLIVCLTNCGDMQGWDNLGIDNIEESCWDTNADYQFNDDTVNPVLAAYKDGPYRLDVTCFSHGDPAVEFPQSINCELHNFSPALREVFILDLETDQTYYHAEWV